MKTLGLSNGLCILLMAVSGCTQTTYTASTYERTVTTVVEINTDIPSQVWISNRSLGVTPITFPFTYQEDVENVTRNANYWETNPGTAAALSVLSLGFYIPFSFIPAEQTTEARPSQKFIGNQLSLRLIAEGYEPLTHVVELKGEPKISLSLSLTKKEGLSQKMTEGR